MRHYFGKQLGKWLFRQAFAILRASLFSLAFFILLPAGGLTSCYTFNSCREAKQNVRNNMTLLLQPGVIPA